MAVLSEAIDFEGTATVTAVTEGGTQLVPVGTMAGGGDFWLPADQLPVCGELLGLVIRGTISRDAGADNESLWVDVQVVGQAAKTGVSGSANHWEAQTADGDNITIAVPNGMTQEDVQRAEDADFWLFEAPLPGVDVPGHFTDLTGFLSGKK